MNNLNIPDRMRAGMPEDDRDATLYCFNRLVDFVADGNNPDHQFIPSEGKTSLTVNGDKTLTIILTALHRKFVERKDLESINHLLKAQDVKCEIRPIYTGLDGKPTHKLSSEETADNIGLELCATFPNSKDAIVNILDAFRAANRERLPIDQTPQPTITDADPASHARDVSDKNLPATAPSSQVP